MALDESSNGHFIEIVPRQGERVQLQHDWFAPSGRVLLRKGTILTVIKTRHDGRIVEAELNGKAYTLLPGEFRAVGC